MSKEPQVLPLNHAWRNWLNDALAQKTPVEKVCEHLIEIGFTPNEVEQAMGTHFPAQMRFFENKAYYQKCASPLVLSNGTTLTKESEHEQIYTIDNFLSEDECRLVQEIAYKKLKPSTISGEMTGKLANYRTSRTCMLSSAMDKRVAQIEAMLWQGLSPQVGGAEAVQAQLYSRGEEYKAHCDYFAPGTESFKKHGGNGGQRTWTLMVYVMAPERGGETHFPKLDLCFKPVRGKAVLWNNLLTDGRVNPQMLHQAMPVQKGTKLILTKWFRTKKVHQNQNANAAPAQRQSLAAQLLNK